MMNGAITNVKQNFAWMRVYISLVFRGQELMTCMVNSMLKLRRKFQNFPNKL